MLSLNLKFYAGIYHLEGGFLMLVSICDDNLSFASQIEEVIIGMKLPYVETEVFSSGRELLAHCSEENRSQIYFLDIEMPGIDGIETARRIRQTDEKALIVFMTQHHEYVYSVFEVLPFRFLRKPFSDADVKNTFLACVDYLNMTGKYFFFKLDRIQHQLPCDEILYFEGRGRKVCLHTRTDEYEFYGKISKVSEDLDDALFCRIHVSFIVNLDSIRSIKENAVVLNDGTELPVSKTYRQTTRERHLDYMMRKNGGAS